MFSTHEAVSELLHIHKEKAPSEDNSGGAVFSCCEYCNNSTIANFATVDDTVFDKNIQFRSAVIGTTKTPSSR